jgi:D-alanyl-D-alanine carboxypeptidase
MTKRFLGAVCFSAFSSAAITTCSLEDLDARIEAFLEPYVSSNNFSGVVFVTREGGVLFQETYGKADHELDVPVKPYTRFFIASVTKTFTAAAVLLLKDRGVLELDDAVGDYIEEFPHGDRITVRHLLEHSSGLFNYYALPDYGELSRRFYEGPADVVALVGDEALQFEPGTRRAYNNINYTALAWLIERVSGVSFAEFLRQELLAPLGLHDTGYITDVKELITNLAKSYDPVGMESFQKSRYYDRSMAVGAGSMYSTASDLARWVEAVTGGGLLSEESRELMLTPQWGGFGYGWLLTDMDGRRVIFGDGWDGVGFSANVRHLPDEGLTVVALCNLNIATVVGEISEGIFALVLGEEPERLEFDLGALPNDSLVSLAGSYRFGDDFYSPGGVLHIVARDGYLFDVGRKPEAGLIPLAAGGFLYRPVWARVRFLADEDGRVGALRFYDRFVAQRVEGP